MYHSGDTGNRIRDTEIQDTGYTIKDAGCRNRIQEMIFGFLFKKKTFLRWVEYFFISYTST